MKKPFIRQRLFSKPSSAQNKKTLPVGALDRISVFETLRSYDGMLFHAREHLDRLEDSCKGIGRSLPINAQEMIHWLQESLQSCGLKNALLRLAIHWFDERDSEEGRLVLFLREFKSHPAVWYQKGVALKTTTRRRWDFNAQDPQIKASQFMNGVLAVLDESGPRAHELVFFGPRGTVAEGAVSNIFIADQKRLLTPAASSGILRGVTRSVVIALARKRGLQVLETLLTRHELYTASECFMTNTSSEVLPVVSLDGRPIGSGAPGPLTRALARDFKQSVRGTSSL